MSQILLEHLDVFVITRSIVLAEIKKRRRAIKAGLGFQLVNSIVLLILSVSLNFFIISNAIALDETLPPPIKEAVATTDHETFIRQAFDLAIDAGNNGNHPFGAVLVYQGKVIMTSKNTVNSDKDHSRHAEINLLVKARREISPEVFRNSTLYTSAAPCMFCCSAIWYSGINKVVFGVSGNTISKLTNFEDKSIPCNKLYQYTDKPIEWIGPVLEEEGLKVFCYWPDDSFRPSLIKKLESVAGKSCDQ